MTMKVLNSYVSFKRTVLCIRVVLFVAKRKGRLNRGRYGCFFYTFSVTVCRNRYSDHRYSMCHQAEAITAAKSDFACAYGNSYQLHRISF